MSRRHAARVAAVRRAMAQEGIDVLVLRPSPDFRFLSASPEGPLPEGAFPEGVLPEAVLPEGAAPDGGVGPGVFLVVTADAIVETRDPAGLVPASARRVGVDPEMRASELFRLAIAAELVPASAVLAPLRLRKDPAELTALGRAVAAAEAVLAQAAELAWFGATERAMARRLRLLAVESGCEEVISLRVSAGEHTARPEHVPGGRVINPGDALLVSVCGRWDGYCAEAGRVFAVAEPPEDYEAMYSVVLAAHRAALAALRPSVPFAELARTVHEVIDASGYGRFAAPHVGRGVGLGHDEGPRAGEDAVFAPGMTVCLEPAIYVPDLFGARVADVVACTAAEPVPLGTRPHPLHVLDR